MDSFFSYPDDNLTTLRKATLSLYCNEIVDFEKIIDKLKKQHFFTSLQGTTGCITDFTKNLKQSELDTPLPQLLAKPLPIIEEYKLSPTALKLSSDPTSRGLSAGSSDPGIERDFWIPRTSRGTSGTLNLMAVKQNPCSQLSKPLDVTINCYIDMLIDVLNNKLAKKPYENINDLENVTERQHALQAGKIALLIGLPLNDVIALLLHDIARPSINDPTHGHANHCFEGSTILKPFGLSTDYAGLHAFAKYLLFHCCPDYKDLISHTSRYTLAIQSKNMASQIESLNNLDASALAPVLYKIMLMRLIDDMSKVPDCELQKIAGNQQIENLDDVMIKKMLSQQIMTHMENLSGEKQMNQFKEELEDALRLLLRAQEYSSNAELYTQYHDVINEAATQKLSVAAVM